MIETFKILDERFGHLFSPTAHLHRLYTGCRWTEVPAYFPAARCLVWSDIPDNRMLRAFLRKRGLLIARTRLVELLAILDETLER
ncbi:MAG TPA: hypothetical protein VGH23_17320 [Rhizomicrobium sp.]|jgi:sugar lactone lactonase YvrE